MERNTFPEIPNEIILTDAKSMEHWSQILAQEKRLIAVDMGCGHGDYMIEHAPNNPGKFFIGVEISRKRIAKTSARLAKRSITNYAVIDSEGELALKMFFPQGSIDEININFPDPWLRKRHWKNRIFKPSFLIQAVRALKTGGKLNFVTDVAEYAEHVAGILKEYPELTNNYSQMIEKNIYESFPTLFYRKMSPLRPINYISLTKI